MNYVSTLIFCFFTLYILSIGSSVIVPFVVAIGIWYLINALAKMFHDLSIFSFKIPKSWCLGLSLTTTVLIIWSIINLISYNISLVLGSADIYQKNFELFLPKIMKFFRLEDSAISSDLASYLNLNDIITFLAKNLTGLAGKAVVVLFYTFFLLFEQKYFNNKLLKVTRTPEMYEKSLKVIGNINKKIQKYLLVKFVISLITGVLTYLVLSYYGLDFSIFWGLLAFVLNFIPYIGSIVAVSLPAMISLVQFGDFSTFTIIVSLLTLIQITLGNILDPRLLGDSLNLSPVAILISLAVWGSIWGVAGMFLAVPILLSLAILFAQFQSTKVFAVILSKNGEIDSLD